MVKIVDEVNMSNSDVGVYRDILRNLVKFLTHWGIGGNVKLFSDEYDNIILSLEDGYLELHDFRDDYEYSLDLDEDYIPRLRYFLVAVIFDLSKRISDSVLSIEFNTDKYPSRGTKQVLDSGDVKIILY